MQPVLQARSSLNGYGRCITERDGATRSDNKFLTGKTNSTRTSFGKGGILESSSHDRLVYLTTCLIGQQVEVQVPDGSIFCGVFHATNAEDFGIVLKMARLIKDGSQGEVSSTDSPNKPPSKTLIIPAKDLVQVIAKGVPITRDGLNEAQLEKQQELMTDSFISQSRHVDVGRELERWAPDDSDTGCTDLENIFDVPWNRGWDQFEVNEMLFGVKSTFDEELYTTKLERGPQMRELEREAIRLAREIEGVETLDLHLAEERGILDGNLEIDEESRFSSVLRVADDSRYDKIEDMLLDSRNDETFGSVSESVIDKPVVNVPDSSEVSKAEDSHSLPRLQKESFDKVSLSAKATAFDPPCPSSKGQDKTSLSNEVLNGSGPPKTQGVTGSLAGPSSSASSTSVRGGATSTSAGRGLSPSSSVGSLSSEKSTLNPHAKEFRFNPNAKSFTPTQAPLRPSSPLADSTFYYPANMTAVTHMHGMPVGIGIGPSFAPQQPVMFNTQGAPIPQPYYHPNGPQMQYGQQMIGHPRPVLYMPTYSSDMPYKGREF